MSEKETKSDTRRSKAYARAGVMLRQAHRDEFNRYYAIACAEQGLDFKERKSKEQREIEAAANKLAKAQETVQALADKYGGAVFDGLVPVSADA